ncbi:hypothetical protein DEU56DRAFT_791841 [Suillus clintonianus]|uniref:uncharacterized protein n=1 Tax=Suillus clintonianus TaxID=1904413 RepID=UPI001B85DCE4|nr:uncharacterized protein DEU56DRAFT_791841 [Suillus clintonianus]KAG2143667.1 hypothetical protein DEU56DRAFT_791841 [Suillus clintonianus]
MIRSIILKLPPPWHVMPLSLMCLGSANSTQSSLVSALSLIIPASIVPNGPNNMMQIHMHVTITRTRTSSLG